jgi:predicted amino acid racemase
MTLIRSPMLSQADQVVLNANVSFNTELDVISKLSNAAKKAKMNHGVVLMVELGDLREGIMPRDLNNTVRQTLRFPNITFKGIGANLACHSGISPCVENMSELSALTGSIEKTFGQTLEIVSGGNSANIGWAFGDTNTERINDLRLGESILLGREPLHRQAIDGLYTDAFVVIAEVIESKVKPSQSWGNTAQTAFGESPLTADRSHISQTILAIGRQDTDPNGLLPPPGMDILGASSDHLIVDSGRNIVSIGTEISFQPNYSALVHAMISPFITKSFL